MVDQHLAATKKLKSRDMVIIASLIAIVTCAISLYILYLGGKVGADFKNILVPARNWLAGKDIYLPFQQNLDHNAVPYPFTAYLAAIPFTWMPDWIASGIFVGLSSGLLAWLILRSKNTWLLLLFLSWPFVYNLFLTQLAPLVISIYFSTGFLPLLLVKPQLALPFVLTQRPNRLGLVLGGVLLLASIILYPTWPLDWLKSFHSQNYIGLPPLIVLPFGPLLLLAILRYREKRSWLLLLMALMPQRMVYDQLGVLLVAENRKQLAFMVVCSWLSFPAVFYYHGWDNLPFGWQQWVFFESYLPALLVVVWPYVKMAISQRSIRLLTG